MPSTSASPNSGFYPAVPGEEGMADVRKRLERGGLKHPVGHARKFVASRPPVKLPAHNSMRPASFDLAQCVRRPPKPLLRHDPNDSGSLTRRG
jgi:hypothetical protein